MSAATRNERSAVKPTGGSPLLAGLIIGGVLGAASMLLLAPQSGRKTREEVREGAIDVKDRTTETMKDTVSQVRSRARQLATDMNQKVNDLENQGKDIAIDQLDRVSKAALAGKRAFQSSKN